MKRLSAALTLTGMLWLLVLLLLPIYIEPGNGDINCGRPWRAAPMEDFLRSDCHRAIETPNPASSTYVPATTERTR